MPTRARRIRDEARSVLDEWAAESREWSRRANMGGPDEPCHRCRQGMTPLLRPWGRSKSSGGVYACMTCYPLDAIEQIEQTKRAAYAEAVRRLYG